MKKVMDVANWFLSQDSMTHKKLQKLCYYAQAWHCALREGKLLFKEDIQAWVHGPVVPSLYSNYAAYGWVEIPKITLGEEIFSENELDILEAVYNTYSEFSGDQLENLTHSEKPWMQARGDLKPWETSQNVISPESMREYYLEKYEQSQND